MHYKLTINREPFGKQEKRVVGRGGYSRSYLPIESRGYMDEIGTEFLIKYGKVLLMGGVKLVVNCYYPIRGTYKVEAGKVRAVTAKVRGLMLKGDIRPLVKPDNSNVLKLVEDGLTGVAWVDDSQVVVDYIEKWFSDKPRMEIEIELL